ncbi:restriction endonuclease subunit S [Anabaena sp. FACHB-1391]|uniref:restriction endonuclease subunit S n=1 Tax=Anabaena sp. FACHB-1391 TaxID=2692771 RepID=UPI00168083CE|nr:restriction endonuclease subunit S [Anabaena sp. FACHB-1391]MBD2269379.1 restriction endonuclease subunit S [Anabaena sp. FACHB-1391]
MEINIKDGYKVTEVGVIPDDWEVKKFREICKVNQGLQIAIEKRIKYPTPNSKKYITIQYLNGSKDIEFIKDYSSSVCCSEEDILMTRTGNTGIVISGVSGIFHNNFFKVNFDRSLLDRKYLIEYLSSNKVQKIILTKAGISTIPDLNHNDFYSISIPLPPLAEQKAIAHALSDVDNLITAIDQLITKKRNLKQGTMQELLTGKKRLPGFSGKWVNINIFDTSILKARIGWQGLTTAEYLKNGDYFLITGTDFFDGRIKWETCFYVDEKRYSQDKNIQLKREDVLITKDGTIGKIAYIDILPIPATLNSGVFVIRPKSDIYLPLYFYYVLYSSYFSNFLRKLQAGSTIAHLYQKDFIGFNFPVPKSLEEQKAIAEILTDIDKEIEALEKKRDKYKTIKQGMMQELLTGKTRIIDN